MSELIFSCQPNLQTTFTKLYVDAVVLFKHFRYACDVLQCTILNISQAEVVFAEDTLTKIYINITKTRLFKCTEISSPNLKIFRLKTLIFFHISAQNIDCGYSLEPPRRGGSNEYHILWF